MEELSIFTSEVIEFLPKQYKYNRNNIEHVNIGTDCKPLPCCKDMIVGTNERVSKFTQTEFSNTFDQYYDENKLIISLRKIVPIMEKELFYGCTPDINESFDNDDDDNNSFISYDIVTKLQLYQKIIMPTMEKGHGMAIWLSVHCNNTPILAVTMVGTHDGWCEHINQYIQLYIPKRQINANNSNNTLVIFEKGKSIKLKTCLRSLCTNKFNKIIFSGSTLDGDLYIWQLDRCLGSNNTINIKQLYNITLTYGCAIALDWSEEHTLLTAHSNGYVIQWQTDNIKQTIIKETEFLIKSSINEKDNEISSLLTLNYKEFIVGCHDGNVYYCSIYTFNILKQPPPPIEIIKLKQHKFMISTLLKYKQTNPDCTLIISCDISGQVYYHYLKENNINESDTLTYQLPLPFKSIIASSIYNTNIIYSPGIDGNLECYNMKNRNYHQTIKGDNLKGKGHFIKCSENGCWLVTGLYENHFQIFAIDID